MTMTINPNSATENRAVRIRNARHRRPNCPQLSDHARFSPKNRLSQTGSSASQMITATVALTEAKTLAWR